MIRPERRREPRERTYQLVTVSTVAREGQPTGPVLGRTLDLSRSGARVEVARNLPPGERVRLDVALKDEVVEAEAFVRHAERGDEDRWHLGLEFIDLPADACDRLVSLLLVRAGEAR